MLGIQVSQHKELKELGFDTIEKGSWFSLVSPDEYETAKVSEVTGIPIDFLNAALDENEHSRIEVEDNCLLVIINIPLMLDKNSFDTMPLGIIVTPDYFVTVCLKENMILNWFNSGNARYFSTFKKTRFLFLILLKSSELYLRYMRYINQLTDNLELSLRKSMKNKSLFQLFELERSLIYFITALKDNGIVTQKLLRLRNNISIQPLLRFYEDDDELLEDVQIETRQAIEMVEMHSNILGGMMDAFASIISNNLNMVMKFLTTVTILLAIPTMISSFWGMNVPVPMAEHPYGFIYILSLSLIVTGLASFFLWRRKMF